MEGTLDLLNPYHRVQEDTRKRLNKYGLVNSALDVLGVWTLANVKLAPSDEELQHLLSQNPVLMRSREYLSAADEVLAESEHREMVDTNNLDRTSPFEN